MPAERVMGMSRVAFETLVVQQGLPQMPYPVDGEYEFVLVFPQEVVPEAAYTTARMIEFQRENMTAKERVMQNAANAVLEAKEIDNKKTNILENAMERSDANQ